jgi:glyoxylate utilization-related uncharacterized protein
MNTSSLLTHLPREKKGGIESKPVLHQHGYTGEFVTLTASDVLDFGGDLTRQDHLLFVVEGALRVEIDGIVSIVNRHDALLVPRGKAVTAKTFEVKRSKFVCFDVPPPPEREPLYTFPDRA